MITIQQCRAARGLLDWTQQDLAEASGLSKTAINNFEKGHSDIKAESLRAIRMAFESADVEFTGMDSLRLKSEKLLMLRENPMDTLTSDILASLRDHGGEVMAIQPASAEYGPDPSAWAECARKLAADGITVNTIWQVLPGTQPPPPAVRGEARSLQAGPFLRGCFIYSDKIALNLWNSPLILLVASAEASAAERARFETLWAQAVEDEQNNKADIAQDRNATNPLRARGI